MLPGCFSRSGNPPVIACIALIWACLSGSVQAAHVVTGDAKVFETLPPFDPLPTAEVGINGYGSWTADHAGVTNSSTLLGTVASGVGEVLFTNQSVINSTNSVRVGVRGQGLLRVEGGSRLNVGSVDQLPNGSYPLNLTVGSPAGGRLMITGQSDPFGLSFSSSEVVVRGGVGIGSSASPGALSNGVVTIHSGGSLAARAIAVSSQSGRAALFLGTDDPLYAGDEAPVGSAVSTVTATDVLYVGFSDQGSMDMDGYSLLNGGNLIVGYIFGGKGVLNANGPNALIDMSKYVSIGEAGIGTIGLTNGARLKTENDAGLFLGAQGGYGKLDLSDGANADVGFMGAGGFGFVAFDVISGGLGEVTVKSGSALQTKTAHLGYLLDGIGRVAVGGAGDAARSRWDNIGEALVGKVGEGSLTIESSGTVTSDLLVIGDEQFSKGTVTLLPPVGDGESARLEIRDLLEVGGAGKGLLDAGNGTVLAGRLRIGTDPSGRGSMNLHGPQAIATVTTQATVGDRALGDLSAEGPGPGGLLEISAGAKFSASALTVGLGSGGSGKLDVRDPGSALEVTGLLTVGDAGQGELRASNAATVNSFGVLAGNALTSQGNRIVVETQAELHASDWIRIGERGSAQLQIDDAYVEARSYASFGVQAGSYGELDVAGTSGPATLGASEIRLAEAGSADALLDSGRLNTYALRMATYGTGQGVLTTHGSSEVYVEGAMTVAERGGASAYFFDDTRVDTLSADIGVEAGAFGHVELGRVESPFSPTASWANEGALRVGVRGRGELLVDHSTLQTASLVLGAEAGSDGAFTALRSLFGPAIDLGAVTVGAAGNGHFQAIGENSDWCQLCSPINADTLVVGAATTGRGEMDLRADLNTAGAIIGDAGRGSVLVHGDPEVPGAITFGNTTAVIGAQASGRGFVGVDDGARWDVTGDLVIGQTGDAAVELDNLARLDTHQALVLGENAAGSGRLTARHGAQIFNYGNTLTVGRYGNASLEVLAGGKLEAGDTAFGVAGGGYGELQVRGAGSFARLAGQTEIGREGDGAVFVSDGARLEGNILRVGNSAADDHQPVGVLEVHTGGRVDIYNQLVLGGSGKNYLTMTDDALVSAYDVTLGYHEGDALDTETLDFGEIGAGSKLSVGSRLWIGAGARSQLLVHEGGEVEAGYVEIGYTPFGAPTTAGALLLDGPGTLLTVHGEIALASTAHSSLFSITHGAEAIVEGNVRAGLGFTYETDAELVVADPGSRLEIQGEGGLQIGSSGPATVTVRDGGTIVASNIHLYGGGVLNGAGGTVEGEVFVDGGTLAPGNSPGLLYISDTLHLANSTLEIEIGGLERGLEYDAIDAGGIEVGGLLKVSLYDFTPNDPNDGIYAPVVGDSFDILRAPAITGEFYDFVFDWPTDLTWAHEIVDLGNGEYAYRLTVTGAPVPLPAAIWLLAPALGLLRARRYREN